MIKRLMILSLLLVSMISKSWAYSFINGFCEYEVISEVEQTVRLIRFVNPLTMSSDTDIALSRFVTDESTNITYQLTEIKYTHIYDPNPKLGSLIIPVSVKKIEGISSIEYSSLIVVEGNPVYDSRNNCNAIIETATNKLLHGCKNTVIPSSVTSIGDYAFYGCSGLTNVTCKSSTPPSLGKHVFLGTPTSTLYVPVGSRSAYSSTSGWSKFDNIVEAELNHVVSTTDVRLVNDGLTWLAVSLENKKDILGFQFDLTLPSGIVVNTGADGKLVSKLGNRCSGFTQTFTYIGDSKYRVTGLSMQGTAVTGHDGELMRISLTSDTKVETGDYDIVLSNIQLTTTEGTATVTIYPEDYNSKLTMLNYALGDIDGNGSITVTDAVMVVQHILYKTPSNFIPETADVNTDGSVNVGDVVSILDLISTSNSKAAPVKVLEAE